MKEIMMGKSKMNCRLYSLLKVMLRGRIVNGVKMKNSILKNNLCCIWRLQCPVFKNLSPHSFFFFLVNRRLH